MHAVFIPYGARPQVEVFLRAIEAELFGLRMEKDGEVRFIGLYGAVRLLPFGVVEAIIPKEHMDKVLTTLNFHQKAPYNISTIAFRKMLKCKKPGKFNTDENYNWDKQNVSLIPIGIREDGEFTDPDGLWEGWTHEAI